MSGVGEAGLIFGIISSLITIIDTCKQVYEAAQEEGGLPERFKQSASKLPLISKLLKDAERYVNDAGDAATKDAFAPILKDCKHQANQLHELISKFIPEEGDTKRKRYLKAARAIGKGNRVDTLIGEILKSLQLLVTKFPEVTTPGEQEELTKVVGDISQMNASLPEDSEQTAGSAHHSGGIQGSFSPHQELDDTNHTGTPYKSQ